MKIDTTYCLYDDVLGEKFDSTRIHYEKNSKKRHIHNKPWFEQDPDAYSNKLYDYHQYLWGQNLGTRKAVYRRVKGREVLCLKSVDDIITSDYIGPSSYHANQAGILDEELGKYLQITRTIGGHVLWPIGLSVNVARGRVFCDRFDVTLFDLKRWYAGLECKLKRQWDSHKEWLEGFGSFVGFVRFFLLHPFVDEKYEIIDLMSTERAILKDYPDALVSRDIQMYRNYFKKSIYAIEERNALIEEFAETEIKSVRWHMKCAIRCKCGSYNVSKVTFGLPSSTGRFLAKLKYIRNMGCVVQTQKQRYHCNECKLDWEQKDKNIPSGGKHE